jgi:hypothetical protein
MKNLRVIESLIALVLVAMAAALIFCFFEIRKLDADNLKVRIALKGYEIANGNNVAAKTLDATRRTISDAARQENIPENWIKAVIVHENGSVFKEACCKRYYADIAQYPIDEWQIRTCARIIAQQYRAFLNEPDNEKHFAAYIYTRYCKKDKSAIDDVLLLKRQYDKKDGKI